MPSSTQEETDAKEQQEVERRVRSALGGGIGGNKPDLDKLTARPGQELDIIDNLLDLEGFNPTAIPKRPDEPNPDHWTSKMTRTRLPL